MDLPPRCPLCHAEMRGDLDAGITPGDRLADHLTDEHDVFSHLMKKGLSGGV